MAFQLTEEKKTNKTRRQETWEHWWHSTKWRYWSQEDEKKIPPDRDWWVGSVLKNYSQWGDKRSESGLFCTFQCFPKGHEHEIPSLKKLLFPFSLDKSLCKVQLVRTISLNWNQRFGSTYGRMKGQSKAAFSRTEEIILEDQSDNWWYLNECSHQFY